MEIDDKESAAILSRQLPEPSAMQERLLKAAGVTLLKTIPAAGPRVGTRVQLQKHRKSDRKP